MIHTWVVFAPRAEDESILVASTFCGKSDTSASLGDCCPDCSAVVDLDHEMHEFSGAWNEDLFLPQR